jgi:putative heme-binding domain-containing protein
MTLGATELGKVLPLFKDAKDEALGLKLLDALRAAPGAAQLTAAALKPALADFPAAVQQRADELLASLHHDLVEQRAHLDELAASLKDGDIRRGQAVFNSPSVGCAVCHAIGYLGGDFAPDLTKIGTVRNERDLLEAVVYPSASFVRSYEPMTVTLKSGAVFSGLLREDSPDGIRLALGPGTEMRFARADIAELAPGTISPMPAGLDKILTRQQLADLIAFLKATKW